MTIGQSSCSWIDSNAFALGQMVSFRLPGQTHPANRLLSIVEPTAYRLLAVRAVFNTAGIPLPTANAREALKVATVALPR